jgi:Tol biopolymer transport system component
VKRAAIVAATLAAAASAAPAQAAFPGRDGLIAYTSIWYPDDCGHSCYEDEVVGLNTIRPDGTGRRRLGRCGLRAATCEDGNAAWSPNGRRIAYRHDASIWVMRADRSHAHRVLRNAISPSWSPNGRRIVFTRWIGEQSWISTMRPDGSHRRRVTPVGLNLDPSWSVRGVIAYTHYPRESTGRRSIVLRRPDGTLVSRFKRRYNVSNPDFSPGGKRIAFERRFRDDRISIWTSRPDGSRARLVAGDGLAPAWSPSGRFIAYSTPVQFRQRDIYVTTRDGSRATRVGEHSRPGDYGDPNWQPLPRRASHP